MKYRNRYHDNTRVIRITLAQYGLLKELGQQLGVSMSEALQIALEAQRSEKVSPAQAHMLPPIQIIATTRVMPSRVTGNGVTHINPKVVREVRDGGH